MKKRLRSLLYPANIIYVTLITALILFATLTKVLVVNGVSMSPTYEDGDYLISVPTDEFQVGDVISVYSEASESFIIKRVVAVAGDYVVSSPTEVIVNGEVIMNMPFTIEKSRTGIVPEGNVFLVGDNYIESYDSRYYGSVPIGDVSYKVIQGIRVPGTVITVWQILLIIVVVTLFIRVTKSLSKSLEESNNEERKERD